MCDKTKDERSRWRYEDLPEKFRKKRETNKLLPPYQFHEEADGFWYQTDEWYPHLTWIHRLMGFTKE